VEQVLGASASPDARVLESLLHRETQLRSERRSLAKQRRREAIPRWLSAGAVHGDFESESESDGGGGGVGREAQANSLRAEKVAAENAPLGLVFVPDLDGGRFSDLDGASGGSGGRDADSDD